MGTMRLWTRPPLPSSYASSCETISESGKQSLKGFSACAIRVSQPEVIKTSLKVDSICSPQSIFSLRHANVNRRNLSGQFGRRQQHTAFGRGRNSAGLRVVAKFGPDKDGREAWESLEIEVPSDQRPVNELAALKEGFLYSWAQLSLPQFGIRMAVLWAAFFVFLGGPISAASFQPSKMPLEFALAASAGAFFAVAILLLRMYLGWSYVGDRLLSAVIPYEETGWYDGQLWVKPPEILARDRLLGTYQVKPVMTRLKQTLLGSASLLAGSALFLSVLLPSPDDAVVYVPRTTYSSSAYAASEGEDKVGFRSIDVNLDVDVDELVDEDRGSEWAGGTGVCW
eukprot:TRINITY_DN795_c0_g1_i2.p1 TRINITY_DN795_c0_g1~~TRINITY_DN795_c0_g1_i2.p1  ORF type:complete len:340 (+),score=44.63 TRINITY_DN795_c0_g1_i2:215-1234(+)